MNVPLILACLTLLAVVALQDFWYPPLRNQTVSSGLTGPYHVLLDASYVPLSVTLVLTHWPNALMVAFALVSAVALLAVATTNTAHRWVDSWTDGKHSLWHSRCTAVVFVAAIALQAAGDRGTWWVLTAANMLLPGAVYGYFRFKPTAIRGVAIAASPAAEKAYIAMLCLWLIAYSL